jgi:hypothetical protein
VSFDILILVSGGILAILGGGILVFMSPGRYPSLVAAAALASLGLLQFGWARAIYDVLGPGGQSWFELSLALALPVSICWMLLSRTLGVGTSPGQLGGWRYYIVAQALLSVGALIAIGVFPPRETLAYDVNGTSFPLRPIGTAMLLAILLNLILLTASFESTYLTFPRAQRHAFRPGLLGILLASAFFAYASASSVLASRVTAADLSLGAIPIACLSLLLPISLIHGRIGEARTREADRSLTRTASLTIAVGYLIAATALIAITRATGWSVARGLWLLVALGGALGTAALAVSNRLQRRVKRLVDPYLLARRAEYSTLSTRATESVHPTRSIAELCELIPPNARELIGADPVTLFLADEDQARFVVVASTLDPPPAISVRFLDPLAKELQRTGRSIQLRGRPDDLEFIPIYVENAAQIAACRATSAAPITRDEELYGFLLCGEPAGEGIARRPLLPLLDLVCRRYSAQVDRLAPGGGRRVSTPRQEEFDTL